MQAIWQKSVFLYLHYLKNGISSADISARACYYRKSIKLNCAVQYTCSSPPMGRLGGVLQCLSHDGVHLTIAEDVDMVFVENLLAIGHWRWAMGVSNTCWGIALTLNIELLPYRSCLINIYHLVWYINRD